MKNQTQRDINFEIMNYIRQHPDATVAQIGKAVGLSRPAAQKRVNRLFAVERLKRIIAVDLIALGFRHAYRIDVEISPGVLSKNLKVTRILKNDPKINDQQRLAFYIMRLSSDTIIIDDVSILFGGPSDLSIRVRTNDPDELMNFVIAQIRRITGVNNTSTAMEGWAATKDRQLLAQVISRRKQPDASIVARRKKSRASKKAGPGPATLSTGI